MSATSNFTLYKKYFGDYNIGQCQFTMQKHDVDEYYLEDLKDHFKDKDNLNFGILLQEMEKIASLRNR